MVFSGRPASVSIPIALVLLLAGCADLDSMVGDHHAVPPAPASADPAPLDPVRPAELAEPAMGDAAPMASRDVGAEAYAAPLPGYDDSNMATQADSADQDLAVRAGEDRSPSFGRREVSGKRLFQVQLASYRTGRDAERGWESLTKRAPDLLDGMNPVITEVRLGPDSNTYFRLRTSAFDSEVGAEALCAALDAQSIECLVVEVPDPSHG